MAMIPKVGISKTCNKAEDLSTAHKNAVRALV